MDSRGYGLSATQKALLFDGDESKYPIWEERMLAYMKVKKLKEFILPGVVASSDKREECYAELIQFLDERSLCLVMRDAKDDGRKALEVLRKHYAGSSEQRIMSLYSTLTSLKMKPNEDVTGYIIRAENAATSLKSVGEIITDRLLNAMVMKGLPPAFEPFTVMIGASREQIQFVDFKVALKNFEDNQRAARAHHEHKDPEYGDGIMKLSHMQINQQQQNHRNNGNRPATIQPQQPQHVDERNPRGSGPRFSSGRNNNNNNSVSCFACGGTGHKSHECPTPNNNTKTNSGGKWCTYCKRGGHTDQNCRNLRRDISKHVQDYSGADEEENHAGTSTHSFIFSASDHETNDT